MAGPSAVKGRVVLVSFPFDDLSGTKLRPAVCLTEPVGPNRHVVVAFITSQPVVPLLASDLALPSRHPDFTGTGLRTDSVLRLHRVVTLAATIIQRELGRLSASWKAEADLRLRALFSLELAETGAAHEALWKLVKTRPGDFEPWVGAAGTTTGGRIARAAAGTFTRSMEREAPIGASARIPGVRARDC